MFNFWCPFRVDESGRWLWYEGTEMVNIGGPGTVGVFIQSDVGGVYDDSEVGYIVAGHGAKHLGIPLQVAILGAHYYNLFAGGGHGYGHLASVGKVFWIIKGYEGYEARYSW